MTAFGDADLIGRGIVGTPAVEVLYDGIGVVFDAGCFAGAVGLIDVVDCTWGQCLSSARIRDCSGIHTSTVIRPSILIRAIALIQIVCVPVSKAGSSHEEYGRPVRQKFERLHARQLSLIVWPERSRVRVVAQSGWTN